MNTKTVRYSLLLKC